MSQFEISGAWRAGLARAICFRYAWRKAGETRVSEAYRVEDFRYEDEGDPPVRVERVTGMPTTHRTDNLSGLIDATESHFRLQMTDRAARAAIDFDGVRIVKEGDRVVVYRTTVREYWDRVSRSLLKRSPNAERH